MILRWVKWGVMGMVGLGLLGGMLFGKDMVSYVKSSAKGVRTVVKDSVPIEFELRRARDMIEEIIPEMHANIRLIAQEEVEVAALKGEITKGQESLKDEENKIKTPAGGAGAAEGRVLLRRQELRTDRGEGGPGRPVRAVQGERSWSWPAGSSCWTPARSP